MRILFTFLCCWVGLASAQSNMPNADLVFDARVTGLATASGNAKQVTVVQHLFARNSALQGFRQFEVDFGEIQVPGGEFRLHAIGLGFAEMPLLKAVLVEPNSAARRESEGLASQQKRFQDAAVIREMQQLLRNSDLVIKGRVSRIENVQSNRRIESEHNPEWWEAVIEIDSCWKGDQQLRTIGLRFPVSEDVHYVNRPQLKVGDEHLYFIKEDQGISMVPKTGGGDLAAQRFVVLNEQALFPISETRLLRRAIQNDNR